MKRFLIGGLMLSVITPLWATESPIPRNIIFMIADGMGPAYLSAHRYAHASNAQIPVEPTLLDTLWVGSAMTYPDDDTLVTDSAAAATALASGIKTRNGMVGQNPDGERLTGLLAHAKAKGKAVGVVTTSQINHATPASFLTHHASRRAYQPIADQIATALTAGEVDILIGGGRQYFTEAQHQQWQQQGISLALDWPQLAQLSQLPAVALLADVALPFALDAQRTDRLGLMLDKALMLASAEPNGFVMMAEASMIDWCGHANDIACALAEMQDFAEAVAVAKAYVDAHPDTLLLITADHETGGLSLGSMGQYQWRPAEVAKVSGTANTIAQALLASAEQASQPISRRLLVQAWHQWVDFELSTQQIEGIERRIQAQDSNALSQYIARIVAAQSDTGWTSAGHTAVDVPVLAYGVGANRFAGMQNNTSLAVTLFELLGVQVQ
ncbi:MAG: alkaline phosphatase [Ferrimonas sp.]